MSLVRLTDHVRSLGEVNRYCYRAVLGVKVWLKPCAILCVRERRAEAVEWLGRKSCWVDERERKFNSGCSRRTRTLVVLLLCLNEML